MCRDFQAAAAAGRSYLMRLLHDLFCCLTEMSMVRSSRLQHNRQKDTKTPLALLTSEPRILHSGPNNVVYDVKKTAIHRKGDPR